MTRKSFLLSLLAPPLAVLGLKRTLRPRLQPIAAVPEHYIWATVTAYVQDGHRFYRIDFPLSAEVLELQRRYNEQQSALAEAIALKKERLIREVNREFAPLFTA